MYNNLTEAIINTEIPAPDPKGVLYTPWQHYYSQTMGDFYKDFIADRLPDPGDVMYWHGMLKEYANREDAIFPVRAGNTSKKLRRGWLVQMDDGFSYMFTDNGFASYIYKMVLDGYRPTADEFHQFMAEFVDPDKIEWLEEINKTKKTPGEIKNLLDQSGKWSRKFVRMPVHFHPAGGSGPNKSETEKNVYINTFPAPVCCLGKYNYKHAHLVGVGETDYVIGGTSYEFKTAKELLIGNDADYTWDSTLCNYVWKRKASKYNGSIPLNTLKAIVKAQFFRFLDPLNHFLAPKSEQNKFTKSDGSFSLDIAEYKPLLQYILNEKQTIFDAHTIPAGTLSYFADFKELVCADADLFTLEPDAADEPIHVVYHEKSLAQALYGGSKKKPSSGGSRKSKGSSGKATGAATSANPLIDLNALTEAYLGGFKVGEIAQQVLYKLIVKGVNTGIISKKQIDLWKTEKGKRTSTFKLSYPLLSNNVKDASGRTRYYPTLPITCYGETLYLCSQWPIKQTDVTKNLIDWILEWIKVNGSIT